MAYRPYIWRKNNPEKRTEQKRREKVRRLLRDRGILPESGEPMDDKQQEIYDQIGNNDFSYWDEVRNKNLVRNINQDSRKTLIKSPEYVIWYRAKENSKRQPPHFDPFLPYTEGGIQRRRGVPHPITVRGGPYHPLM
jgi:hypothetical protein